jgi:hypothetical protein
MELGGRLPGDHEPDGAILERLYERVFQWSTRPDEIRSKVHMHARQYPSAWFLKAAKRLKLRAKGQVTWGLMSSVLVDWHIAGAADPGPEDLYDDDLKLLPASASQRAASAFRPRSPAPAALPPRSQMSDADRARARERAAASRRETA